MTLDFPDFCIRGIEKSGDINTVEDTAKLTLYLPDNRTAKNRTDKNIETSVNWEDNNEVLDFTLNFRDKENNKLVFPHGAVKLPRAEIDRIISNPATQNAISYERNDLTENHYHGNILFSANMPQLKQNLIASTLALYSSKVQRLSNDKK